MTPAKIYPFSIPAGGSFPLLVIGDYCKILTSSGALTLTGDTFGTIGPILAGQGVEDSPFQRLVLTDNTGAVNNGTILIADNKFVDDRITGEVNVIDGGKSRTNANTTFLGYCHAAAVAANYSHMQLFNPVASGKNVVVKSIFLSTNVAGFFILKSSATQLTTLLSTGGAPKKIGGTVGTTEQRFQAAAIQLGDSLQFVLQMSANTPLSIKLEEPIVIPPGKGVMMVAGSVNQEFPTTFEYYEEQIL